MSKVIPKKVRAYIFWNDLLLVFHEPEFPEALYQVPGGTVDAGETLLNALVREIKEETGQSIDGDWKLLGQEVITHPVRKLEQEEYIYYLEFTGDLPTSWDHLVTGAGEDNGILFRYNWMDVAKAQQLLVSWMGDHLRVCVSWRESTKGGVYE